MSLRGRRQRGWRWRWRSFAMDGCGGVARGEVARFLKGERESRVSRQSTSALLCLSPPSPAKERSPIAAPARATKPPNRSVAATLTPRLVVRRPQGANRQARGRTTLSRRPLALRHQSGRHPRFAATRRAHPTRLLPTRHSCAQARVPRRSHRRPRPLSRADRGAHRCTGTGAGDGKRERGVTPPCLSRRHRRAPAGAAAGNRRRVTPPDTHRAHATT